jgi:phage major head subunit gpT-like protein
MAFGPYDLPVGPLTKGLKAVFMQAYKLYSEKSLINRICTVVKSETDSEDYSWLGAVPKVREFLGPRQMKDLAAFNYNIRNKTWENTLGIKRTDLEDQKLGMVTLRVQQLAEEAARYPEELAMSFLTGALGSAATPYLCYDGQGFFDTDHTITSDIGGAVQSNRAGTALAIATLWAGISAMRMFKDDTGRVMNMVPDLLLVEPCLEQTAKELIPPAYGGISAQVSVLSNMGIDVEVSPLLYSTTTVANGNWFLLNTKSAVKPLILQQRAGVEFGSLEKESDSGFMRDEYTFGTRARYNVGAGPWFTIYGNAGAG